MTEKTFIIPLRKAFIKGSRLKKTNKAVSALRKFIVRHMKSEDIAIQKELNNEIWKHGIKNPPGKVKVTAIKDEKGKVFVQKFGEKIVLEAKPKKKEKANTPMDKIKEAIQEKKEAKEPKKEETKIAAEVKEVPKKVEETKKAAEVKEEPKKAKETKKATEHKKAESKPVAKASKPATKKEKEDK